MAWVRSASHRRHRIVGVEVALAANQQSRLEEGVRVYLTDFFFSGVGG